MKTLTKLQPQADFIDFGAPKTLGSHVFRMTFKADHVSLSEDYGTLVEFDENPEKPRATLPPAVWKQISPFVKRDFNDRLRAQGRKAGTWKTAGEVLLDRLLGRELAMLFWSLDGLTESDDAEIGAALRAWQAFRPEERWWLAGQVIASDSGTPDDSGKAWRRALVAMTVGAGLERGRS